MTLNVNGCTQIYIFMNTDDNYRRVKATLRNMIVKLPNCEIVRVALAAGLHEGKVTLSLVSIEI